jgi:bacterioferritin
MVCRENGDSISMKLFETIIDEEQAHFNYFDNVGEHITNLGAAYLSQIAGTPADSGAPSKGFIASKG